MLLEAIHTTRYIYEGPVSQCLSEAHLAPRECPGQHVLETRLQIHPEPAVMDQRDDYFGNHVHTYSIFRNHDRFITTSTSIVEVARKEDPAHEIPWEQARDLVAAQADDAALDAFEFVFESPFVVTAPELAVYGRESFKPGRPLAEAARELSHRIHQDFTYLPKSTAIDQPLMEVFHNRCGVCQDFSHVMIGVIRSLRLPARYVSGYLRSGQNYQGAGASHAWVSVFVPGLGPSQSEWLSLDPDSGLPWLPLAQEALDFTRSR